MKQVLRLSKTNRLTLCVVKRQTADYCGRWDFKRERCTGKLAAGASLVQLYSGLIYRRQQLIADIVNIGSGLRLKD
jgi:hypothetical protein